MKSNGSQMSENELERLQEENKALQSKLNTYSSYMDRFNMIIDDTHEWVWEVDVNGVYTYASKQVKAILGYEPEELIGKTPFDLMSADEAQRVGKIFAEIAFQEKSFSKLKNNCLHKDGHVVHTETSGQPIYDENGIFLGYRGIDFDRTQEFSDTQALQDKNIHLQKALHDQHELLLNVTNSISDFLFYKDTQYRYTGCNQAFSDFLGLPIDYIIGKTDYELFPTQFADLFRSMDKRVIEGLESYSNYEWVEHADGRRLYMLTQKSPLFNTQASLIGMVGIARDMTKEHELEEQLKVSNDYLVTAQSIASVGHWDWDIISGRLFWSDEIYHIFGYEPQAFGATYDAFLQTIHPEDREMVAEAVKTSVAEHQDYNIFHRIVLPDDTQKVVHEIGHAIYDETGRPVQMIGTVQDVTELKRMENELAEQKEAFESIFEYSSDGLSLIEDGRFIACNQAVVRMMRASSKEDFLNIHPSQLSPQYQPDGRNSFEKAEEMMQICIEKGRNQFEWVHTRKNGEEFWAEILLTRLIIKDKPLIHVSWRDISERKFLENTLQTSNIQYRTLADQLDKKVKEQSAQMIKQSRMAQMGELLSMIAHQWRQPLSSIAAVASSIKIKLSLTSDEAINEESKTYLDRQMDEIETLTQSLSSTINDFRTLYKPDKVKQYVHISDPIERALQLMGITLEKDAVKIERIYESDISVQMHANEIMQVMLNLLKNADDNFLEKSVAKPLISIYTTEEEKFVRIEVCDNGGGIREDIIEKIFDPYFSTKDDKNGTGLGLYMSKIIIEQQHRGQLNAYNRDDGVCFNIELPKQ